MRVVLDTNVLVQALITAHGPANTIVGLALTQSFELLMDDRILEEYPDVLSRARFKFHRSDVHHLLACVTRVATLVQSRRLPGGIKGFPDQDDVAFLETAVSGRAQVLVTANLRHFPPGLRHGVTVLTPADFVRKYVHVGA